MEFKKEKNLGEVININAKVKNRKHLEVIKWTQEEEIEENNLYIISDNSDNDSTIIEKTRKQKKSDNAKFTGVNDLCRQQKENKDDKSKIINQETETKERNSEKNCNNSDLNESFDSDESSTRDDDVEMSDVERSFIGKCICAFENKRFFTAIKIEDVVIKILDFAKFYKDKNSSYKGQICAIYEEDGNMCVEVRWLLDKDEYSKKKHTTYSSLTSVTSSSCSKMNKATSNNIYNVNLSNSKAENIFRHANELIDTNECSIEEVDTIDGKIEMYNSYNEFNMHTKKLQKKTI